MLKEKMKLIQRQLWKGDDYGCTNIDGGKILGESKYLHLPNL